MRRNEDGEVEVNTGEGQDCTSISNVKGVECYSSRCVISKLPKYQTYNKTCYDKTIADLILPFCEIASCKPGFRQTGLGCASIN